MVSGSGATTSGTINIQSGTSTVSAGGIYIAAGTSMSSTGSAVGLVAGKSTSSVGGIISLLSGTSAPGYASGAVSLATADADTTSGDSGVIKIESGAATSVQLGPSNYLPGTGIELRQGRELESPGRHSIYSSGGSVSIDSGDSTLLDSVGGAVTVNAGGSRYWRCTCQWW